VGPVNPKASMNIEIFSTRACDGIHPKTNMISHKRLYESSREEWCSILVDNCPSFISVKHYTNNSRQALRRIQLWN
jgi:hypothetical protein